MFQSVCKRCISPLSHGCDQSLIRKKHKRRRGYLDSQFKEIYSMNGEVMAAGTWGDQPHWVYHQAIEWGWSTSSQSRSQWSTLSVSYLSFHNLPKQCQQAGTNCSNTRALYWHPKFKSQETPGNWGKKEHKTWAYHYVIRCHQFLKNKNYLSYSNQILPVLHYPSSPWHWHLQDGTQRYFFKKKCTKRHVSSDPRET